MCEMPLPRFDPILSPYPSSSDVLVALVPLRRLLFCGRVRLCDALLPFSSQSFYKTKMCKLPLTIVIFYNVPFARFVDFTSG